MKYFGDSGRYQQAANLFEKLAVKEPEVSSLLAKSYIGMSEFLFSDVDWMIYKFLFVDEEVKAVQIMAAAMRQTPQSYTLLHVQCDFLRSKGQNQWALKLARQAVNCAPSEFVTWEKLADIYIDLMQYDSVWSCYALLPVARFAFSYSSLGTLDTQLMSDVYIQRS